MNLAEKRDLNADIWLEQKADVRIGMIMSFLYSTRIMSFFRLFMVKFRTKKRFSEFSPKHYKFLALKYSEP